jgi:AcrR family transcriptional regulator
VTEPAPTRRRYDSPVRRERAAKTRERIIVAGAELLHGFPVWNWRALTVRAVADRAGVNERTVYRYFANERELRDAVLEVLEAEAGVDLTGLTLDDVRDVTTRILEYSSSFPVAPRTERDETVAAANARQREALLAAVAEHTAQWSEVDRTLAAAMFDVLWSPVSFERIVVDWDVDAKEAIRGITWVIDLVHTAITDGRAP